MSDTKELKERLFHKKENGWKSLDESSKQNIFNYSEGYMKFLNSSKTEREIKRIFLSFSVINVPFCGFSFILLNFILSVIRTPFY